MTELAQINRTPPSEITQNATSASDISESKLSSIGNQAVCATQNEIGKKNPSVMDSLVTNKASTISKAQNRTQLQHQQNSRA